MNIQFYIDKKDQPKSLIMGSFSDRSERLRISTRISVSPKDWSDTNKKLKPSAESSAYIKRLEQIKIMFTFFYNRYQSIERDRILK
jgi:hypothetical protein